MAKRVTVRFRTQPSTIFFWLMALAGLGLVFAVTTLPTLGQNRALSQQVQQLADENARLQERLQHLKLEEHALRSDPGYNEALARRELGLVRPREEALWTPPPHLRSLISSPLEEAEGRSRAGPPAPPSWAALSRLGPPGRFLGRALDRLSTDASARRDAVLLAMALLTAAFLLFGDLEKPPTPRSPRLPTRSSRR